MTAIRHLSFDLDGTLVDSFEIMRLSWDAATRQLGITCGFEKYRSWVGLPFPKILEKLGLSNAEAELAELYFAGTRAMQDRIRKVEGADEVLAWCRDRGLGTSVITSKPRRNAAPLLEAMGFEVDLLVCADDVPRGKPDPQSARVLCETLGLRPEEILYVGDMVFDFQFALNAGMRFLMFDDRGRYRLPANLLNRVETVPRLAEIPARVGRTG